MASIAMGDGFNTGAKFVQKPSPKSHDTPTRANHLKCVAVTALVLLVLSGCGWFVYGRKNRRMKKKWLKKRGADGKGAKGLKGKFKGRSMPGAGMSSGAKQKVAMAKAAKGGMSLETAATFAKAFK